MSRLTTLTTMCLAVLAGLLGMALCLAALHAYQDHQAFHELIQIEVQRLQAAQPQTFQPAPPLTSK